MAETNIRQRGNRAESPHGPCSSIGSSPASGRALFSSPAWLAAGCGLLAAGCWLVGHMVGSRE